MKRRPVLAATVAATAILAAGCSSTRSAPPLSAACKHEVAAQNAFVHRQVALGYPNLPTMLDGIAVLRSEGVLLKNLRKVCPGTVKIHTLPR